MKYQTSNLERKAESSFGFKNMNIMFLNETCNISKYSITHLNQ